VAKTSAPIFDKRKTHVTSSGPYTRTCSVSPRARSARSRSLTGLDPPGPSTTASEGVDIKKRIAELPRPLIAAGLLALAGALVWRLGVEFERAWMRSYDGPLKDETVGDEVFELAHARPASAAPRGWREAGVAGPPRERRATRVA
jgi:hypothetical protein